MHSTAETEQEPTGAATKDRGRSVGVESRSGPDLGSLFRSLFGSLGTFSTNNDTGHAGRNGLLSSNLGAIESALLRQHIHLEGSLHHYCNPLLTKVTYLEFKRGAATAANNICGLPFTIDYIRIVFTDRIVPGALERVLHKRCCTFKMLIFFTDNHFLLSVHTFRVFEAPLLTPKHRYSHPIP